MLNPRRVRAIAPPEAIVSLLERAIQTRANVLIEGATRSARSVLARGIHERSWRNLGRVMVSLDACSLEDRFLWNEILSGNLTAPLQSLGITLPLDPGQIGTIYLDEIERLSAERQTALGCALGERDDQIFGGAPGPRIIGGSGQISVGPGAHGIDPRLLQELAVVQVTLSPAARWEDLIGEWILEEGPAAPRAVRLEWY